MLVANTDEMTISFTKMENPSQILTSIIDHIYSEIDKYLFVKVYIIHFKK